MPHAQAHAQAPVGVPGPYPTDLSYTDRETKALYIARKYAPILVGSVLDVGCDSQRLKALIANPDRYVGVDMGDRADVVLNLDKDDLPFTDQSFDCVVCTDVLEHLERCHEVFDELCRVSRSRVIVSLPNPLQSLVQSLFEGHAGRLKYYGLPAQRPRDRHRWFFGFEEAAEFLRVRGEQNSMRIEQLDAERVAAWYWLVGKDQRDAMASMNVRAGTCWCVLRRADHA